MIASQLDETAICEALRQVIDPELDCNIIDLGLVDRIDVEGSKVTVRMTLTTRGCPMHESIACGVQCVLLNLEGVEEVDLQLVWNPPWTPNRMTEDGRARTGVYES